MSLKKSLIITFIISSIVGIFSASTISKKIPLKLAPEQIENSNLKEMTERFGKVYVYSSLAWYTVAKKLKNKNAWLAWIPIINIALVLQLGNFHWAWIFLLLIPVLGWIALFVIGIIALWRIFKKRKYPGWFSLALIIPEVGGILYLISIGFLAWGKKTKRK